MNAGVTFERVYHALKDQITGGRFPPGAHLEPASLAPALNASITPVRDALHRLSGERLVDTPRGEGFRIPPATEIGLRHLYRLNAGLLDLAVRTRLVGHEPPLQGSSDGEDIVERAEGLFLAIAHLSANPELTAAIARLNDRLRAVRKAELATVADPAGELADIAGKLEEGVPRALRRAVFVYHRAREKHVDRVVVALQDSRPGFA